MELSDLTHDQHLAMVALAEAVAISDGTVSDAEGREIGRIASALGEDAYRRLLDEAETRLSDRKDLEAFLETIKGQEARELIYGTALEEAMSEPSADHGAAQLLEWLAGAWGIRVELEPGTDRA